MTAQTDKRIDQLHGFHPHGIDGNPGIAGKGDPSLVTVTGYQFQPSGFAYDSRSATATLMNAWLKAGSLGFLLIMSKAIAGMIERKNSAGCCDDANARCRASSHPPLFSDFSSPMDLLAPRSTSSIT
jgi:hypothetical protein